MHPVQARDLLLSSTVERIKAAAGGSGSSTCSRAVARQFNQTRRRQASLREIAGSLMPIWADKTYAATDPGVCACLQRNTSVSRRYKRRNNPAYDSGRTRKSDIDQDHRSGMG
jgi:hypothetical protein